MTQRSICSAVIALAIVTHLHAQSLDWAHTVSGTQQEIAYAVTSGTDGIVITVGTFTLTTDLDPGPGTFSVTSNGSSDVFIQTVDSVGGFLWGGAFGGTSADYGYGVVTDADGQVYITGRAAGTVDLDPSAGTDSHISANTTFDVFVVKLSVLGAYQWGVLVGGNGNDEGRDVEVDSEGHVVIAGILGFPGGDIDPGPTVVTAGGLGQQDVLVLELDGDGNYVWGFAVGGTANDIGYGVAVDEEDNVFVCGEFRNTVDFDPGANVLSRVSGGTEDIFVLKMDVAGAVQWVQAFGGTGSERGRAIAVGPDGGPVFTGRITSATDFDPGAGVLSLAGDFTEPAFMAKLNADGSSAWAFMLKSFLNEGMDLAVDEQNNAYVCGSFGTFGTTALDLDPGPDTTPLLVNGGGDAFIASYTGEGSFNWGFNVGGAQGDVGHSLSLGTRGRVQLVGVFYGTLDADPGPDTHLLAAAGQQDAFIIQYAKPDCAGIFVRPKVVLEGPHTPADFLPMSDHLRTAGLIPLAEPYSALGFALEEAATTTTQVFVFSLSNAIVDWVLVELRDASDPTDVLARRAALLQRDGDVVGTDGVAPVGFCLPPGNYHVAVRHRNHLGVMTAAPIPLASGAATLDLTLPSTPVFGTDARHDVNGVMALWPGNVVPNPVVSYTGSGNDRDPILVRVGSTVPTNTVPGYWPEDVNLDGIVKYTGSGNDRDRVLLVVGGSTPNALRTEQLP